MMDSSKLTPPPKRKKPTWRILKIGPDASVYSKSIDDEIMERMPASNRTFLDVSLFDRLRGGLNSLLRIKSRIDAPD